MHDKFQRARGEVGLKVLGEHHPCSCLHFLSRNQIPATAANPGVTFRLEKYIYIYFLTKTIEGGYSFYPEDIL